MRQDNYIILASNVKSFGDTNTISNFRTKLAKRREFPPNEDWRVAITEITYKQSWYTIGNSIKFEYYTEHGTLVLFNQEVSKFAAGYFATIKDLILAINNKMELLIKMQDNNFSKVDTVPKLYYNPNSHIIQIHPGVLKKPRTSAANTDVLIKFLPNMGKEIESLLGLVDSKNQSICERICGPYENPETPSSKDEIKKIMKMFDNNKIYGSYPADISAGFNNLYIYSNIVQHSDVGDTFAPILTTVPNKWSLEGWGGSVHHEPKNLVYRPLQTRIFDTIDIDIKDDAGNFVPFKLGNVVIKLHFLKHG